MRNLRIFIKMKNLEQLKAFSDEVYLYAYIVNNYTELDDVSMFRNPTFITRVDDTAYMYIENLTEDDVDVWNDTYKELNKKGISYYAVITDTSDGSFFVYNNLKEDIPFIEVGKDTLIVEAIKKIEDFSYNIMKEFQEEMEI